MKHHIKNKLKKVKSFFEENDWDIKLLIFAVIAFILDVVGFKIMFEQNHLHGNWWDYAYLSIRVFGFDLQTPAIDTPIPLILEIGRWLSAGVTIYAVLITLKHIFYTSYKLSTQGNNHIVIIGLGEKGKTLGMDWINKTNDLIVFIEKDKNNSNIDLLKEKDALVLIGDATNIEILQKAKVQNAKYVVVVTDSDATNIEIISTFINQYKDIKQEWYIHINHNEFYDFFRAKIFDGKNIKIFNIYSNAARLYMKQKLLGSNVFVDKKSIIDKNVRVRVAIFGFEKLAENILIHILHLGHFYNENPIEISVVYDKDTDKNKNLEDEFFKQYDILNEQYNGIYWNIEFIDDGEFNMKNKIYNHIIVAYENEFESLSNLMKLLKNYNDVIIENNIDIALYSNSFKNTADIIQNDKSEENTVFQYVRTFGAIDDICNYDIVINESLDKKAMLNNKYYNDLHGYSNNEAADIQWKELDIFLKDSNRYLVEHNEIKKYIISKLLRKEAIQSYEEMKKIVKEKYFNYDKMRLNWDEFEVKPVEYATKLSFEELEQLSKMEHNRWNAFHILNGWKPLKIKDNKKKIFKDENKKLHPCLVSWNELDLVSENHQHNYKSDDLETIMRIPSLEKLVKEI